MTRRPLLDALSLLIAALAAACSGGDRTDTPPMNLTQPTPVATPSPAPVPEAPSTARYRVTFDATWTAATHPRDFPGNAHFSPLVGATHTARVSFWSEGALATEGIRGMAERGSRLALDQEIRTAIAAGTAQHLLAADGIPSPASISLEFDSSREFPLITLVTMIAPSPDWFVGVSGLALFEDMQWVEERTVTLIPWDAGTDSGATFSSPDQNTNPRQPISRILTPPLGVGGQAAPLGSFTFRRIG
ncbi:MAG: spondin domain-containing protein [Acidobacteria bacterium]|nr:spondin domain-containing protein [Acidobacteriota bacterium]